jgi:predicted ferric reductase
MARRIHVIEDDKGDPMNDKIRSHRFITCLAFFLLILLFLISENGTFSSQKDEEAKVIFFVK